MNKIGVIGLDLAKNVFQLHGVDKDGEIVLHKQLTRSQMQRFFAKLSPVSLAGKPALVRTPGADPCQALGILSA